MSNSHWQEIVISPKGGKIYQAGAPEYSDAGFASTLRLLSERSLFFFAKVVVGGLKGPPITTKLHLPVCNYIQKRPPFRKLLLMPRNHAKTFLGTICLTPHILIQPAETNIYFPGIDGSDARILIAGETAQMGQKNHRAIQAIFETNEVFRALWPHRTYKHPAKEARKWNIEESIIPRDTEFPDPSIRAVGVGVAITGMRPTVQIKDDLISFAARNSEVEMSRAIEWHKASRALFEEFPVNSGLGSLEYLLGTHWSVFDLYTYIETEDPTVEVNKDFKSIIQNGEMIWPERFALHTIKDSEGRILKEGINDLKKQYGSLFPLLFMNDAADPDLVDFDMTLIRHFEIQNGNFTFSEDLRDTILEKQSGIGNVGLPVGAVMSTKQAFNDALGQGRGEYLRMKYG